MHNRQTNGQMDGWKEGCIEVGAPPKKQLQISLTQTKKMTWFASKVTETSLCISPL